MLVTKTKKREIEWPTWLLVLIVYSSWLFLLSNYFRFGYLFSAIMLIIVLGLHSSMVHEIIHGHPTRNEIVNALLALPPLSLLFPYCVYRDFHLTHHNNENLTLPGIDPESYFVTPDTWRKLGRMRKFFHQVNMTLAGRLILGPSISLVFLGRQAYSDFRNATGPRKLGWINHVLLIVALLIIVQQLFKIPLWHYLLIAYAAQALSLVRSFFEHRAVPSSEQRCVLMEANFFWRLLFLNNCLHLVHHRYPDVCWYRLPVIYRQHREYFRNASGGFVVKGYSKWFFRYLFSPVTDPVHPFYVSDR